MAYRRILVYLIIFFKKSINCDFYVVFNHFSGKKAFTRIITLKKLCKNISSVHCHYYLIFNFSVFTILRLYLLDNN